MVVKLVSMTPPPRDLYVTWTNCFCVRGCVSEQPTQFVSPWSLTRRLGVLKVQ
jgi:hypothetical protein